MSKGIVVFGINNSRVNYIHLAIIAASFIKVNMPGINICLITNEMSKLKIERTGKFNLHDYFSEIVVLPTDNEVNPRIYRDTQYYDFKDNFNNKDRSNAYALSPYDETLLIDTDYLICNDTFNLIWGNIEDVLINKKARTIVKKEMSLNETRLSKYGIPMYWATLIYFKKSKKAEVLFNFVEFIKDNWEFYKVTYDFPGYLYRNDYAFSIAIHILNGFIETEDYYPSFPDKSILTVTDLDQFYKIIDNKTLMFFINDPDFMHRYYLSKTSGLNIHCMNKLSLLNNMDTIMETLNV